MEVTAPVAAIMIGLQGSGKSTFVHRYLSDMVYINLDTLHTRHREEMLFRECLEACRSFAVDNTNPTRADRERYISAAGEAGYRIVGYFMKSEVPVCMERNRLRTGKARVPDIAIAATAKKLELPRYDEGFDELYSVCNDGVDMTVTGWEES